VNVGVSLWQAGIVLLIFLLIGLFVGSLRLGAKFRERQQARRDRKLENRRSQIAIAAGTLAQARVAKLNAEKPLVKKQQR